MCVRVCARRGARTLLRSRERSFPAIFFGKRTARGRTPADFRKKGEKGEKRRPRLSASSLPILSRSTALSAIPPLLLPARSLLSPPAAGPLLKAGYLKIVCMANANRGSFYVFAEVTRRDDGNKHRPAQGVYNNARNARETRTLRVTV